MEPKSVRVLKFTLVIVMLVLVITALTAPESGRYRVGTTMIRPMDLMIPAIPLAGLMLVYECLRSIVRSLARRKEAEISNQVFLNRLASREGGYRISRSFMGSKIVYQERSGGRWLGLTLPAKDWGKGKLRYECVSLDEWERLTPPWAWPRKDEIEYRIKSDRLCDCS